MNVFLWSECHSFVVSFLPVGVSIVILFGREATYWSRNCSFGVFSLNRGKIRRNHRVPHSRCGYGDASGQMVSSGVLYRSGEATSSACIYRVIQRTGQCPGRWQCRSLWEKQVHMNACLILSGYRDTAVWICTYINIVSVTEKEKLLTRNFPLTLL